MNAEGMEFKFGNPDLKQSFENTLSHTWSPNPGVPKGAMKLVGCKCDGR